MRSAGRSAAPGLADAGSIADYTSDACRYLTDGVNLYRHVGAIHGAMGYLIGLENCRSMDVTLWPVSELRDRQLRAVIPATGNQKRGGEATPRRS